MCLIEQLGVLEVLAALLQLGQGLQELHGRGHLGQLALAHKVLDQGPHVDVRGRGLLRRRQRCPPLPSWLVLQYFSSHLTPIQMQGRHESDARAVTSALRNMLWSQMLGTNQQEQITSRHVSRRQLVEPTYRSQDQVGWHAWYSVNCWNVEFLKAR